MMLPHIRLYGGTRGDPCDHRHSAPNHRIFPADDRRQEVVEQHALAVAVVFDLVASRARPAAWRCMRERIRPLCRLSDTVFVSLERHRGVTGVTRREYYVRRTTECILAAERCPDYRATLMHVAATYESIAIEVESRQNGTSVTAAP
jgi:hypothetical protein